jgi:hypothetical protein
MGDVVNLGVKFKLNFDSKIEKKSKLEKKSSKKLT